MVINIDFGIEKFLAQMMSNNTMEQACPVSCGMCIMYKVYVHITLNYFKDTFY